MFGRMNIRNKLAFILWSFALAAYAIGGVGLALFQNLKSSLLMVRRPPLHYGPTSSPNVTPRTHALPPSSVSSLLFGSHSH